MRTCLKLAEGGCQWKGYDYDPMPNVMRIPYVETGLLEWDPKRDMAAIEPVIINHRTFELEYIAYSNQREKGSKYAVYKEKTHGG